MSEQTEESVLGVEETLRSNELDVPVPVEETAEPEKELTIIEAHLLRAKTILTKEKIFKQDRSEIEEVLNLLNEEITRKDNQIVGIVAEHQAQVDQFNESVGNLLTNLFPKENHQILFGLFHLIKGNMANNPNTLFSSEDLRVVKHLLDEAIRINP